MKSTLNLMLGKGDVFHYYNIKNQNSQYPTVKAKGTDYR